MLTHEASSRNLIRVLLLLQNSHILWLKSIFDHCQYYKRDPCVGFLVNTGRESASKNFCVPLLAKNFRCFLPLYFLLNPASLIRNGPNVFF